MEVHILLCVLDSKMKHSWPNLETLYSAEMLKTGLFNCAELHRLETLRHTHKRQKKKRLERKAQCEVICQHAAMFCTAVQLCQLNIQTGMLVFWGLLGIVASTKHVWGEPNRNRCTRHLTFYKPTLTSQTHKQSHSRCKNMCYDEAMQPGSTRGQ